MWLSMAKQKEKKEPTKFFNKTFVKVLLTLLSVALMFMGPTYFIYVLQRFSIPYVILVLLGLASFALGVVLFANIFVKEKQKL
jgi:hypothetical protein